MARSLKKQFIILCTTIQPPLLLLPCCPGAQGVSGGLPGQHFPLQSLSTHWTQQHNSQKQNLKRFAQSRPSRCGVQRGKADLQLLRAEPSPPHSAKSHMFFSLFCNPHPRNSHLGCWHLFNSEKCQDRGFFKPSWIIPFFLGQVIPGHSPAVSKRKGKQDTQIQTEGVCSSLAITLKRLTGMLTGMASSGLGMSPATAGTWTRTKEAAAWVTQLEEWRHRGGGVCFLPPFHVYKKLL